MIEEGTFGICKEYANVNNLTVKNSVIILLDTYPNQIKKILLDS